MNSSQSIKGHDFLIFSQKLLIFVLLLSSILAGAMISSIYNQSEVIESVYKLEIPIVESTAISIRFNESLSQKINELQYIDVTKESINSIKTTFQILDYYVEDLNLLIKKYNEKLYRPLGLIDRARLFEIENDILKKISLNSRLDIKKYLKARDYNLLVDTFKQNAGVILENLAIEREQDLQNVNRRSKNYVILFTIILLVVLFCWIIIFLDFRRNLKQKIELIKALEEQRAYSFQTAKLASLGEMSAGIAHEINNPLTVIIGSLTMLRTNKFDSEKSLALAHKQIDRCMLTAERITNIVKSLRTLSRDGKNDELISLDFDYVIKETVPLLKETLKNSNVNLDLKLKSTDVCIMGRATEISQLVLNLVSNACDALIEVKEGRVVVISTEIFNNTDTVELSVIDNANGIADEIIDNIFDPFFTTKKVGKGTGLGLSLCKKIIDAHEGSVVVESSKEGTAFKVQFPIIKN